MSLEAVVRKLKRYCTIGKERTDLAVQQKDFEGIVSRMINRKISAPIAACLYEIHQDLNPNHMTYLFTAMGVVGGAAFVFNEPYLAIAGGVLAQTSSVLDGIDGDYARRLTNRTEEEKNFGARLDTILDRVVDISVISGMAYYAYSNVGIEGAILGGTALVLSLTSTFSGKYLRKKFKEKMQDVNKFLTGTEYLGGRDVRLLTLALGAVGEGLSYFYPEIKGIPITASLGLVSAFSLTAIGNRLNKYLSL